MSRAVVIISLVFLFISCDKESNKTTYDENQLIGVCRLNSVTFNEIDGKDINDRSVSSGTILSFKEDDFFYRNYIVGSWLLKDTGLSLIPKEEIGIDIWKYKILELTEDTIKLKIESTKGNYFYNFDAFESDEMLTIIETYTREE